MVRTLPSTAEGVGLTPGWGTEAPQAVRYSQKLKSRIQFKVFWITTQRQGTRMDGPLVCGQEGPAEPLITYPMPEMSLQKRKAPYPCTKEEREAKEALMAREMLRTRFLPSLSARPPRTKAPPIIPR